MRWYVYTYKATTKVIKKKGSGILKSVNSLVHPLSNFNQFLFTLESPKSMDDDGSYKSYFILIF